MRLSTLFIAYVALFALLAGAAPARAEDTAEDAPASDVPDFSKMKVRELLAILEDRGLECRGCAEKADYVAMARDNYHLPVVPKPEPAETETTANTGADKPFEGKSKEDVDRILRDLGMGGYQPTGDPERDAIMKKLEASGIKFAGANNMPIDQLRNLEKTMSGIKKDGGAGKEAKKTKRAAAEEEGGGSDEL